MPEYAADHLADNPSTGDWRAYLGVDVAPGEDDMVKAAAAGTVYSVYADGYETTYASLYQEILVMEGEAVYAGQDIGYAGTSAAIESAVGPYVHFSVTRNGAYLDPTEFLKDAP